MAQAQEEPALPPTEPSAPPAKPAKGPGPAKKPPSAATGKEAQKLQEYQQRQTVLELYLLEKIRIEGQIAWLDANTIGVQPTDNRPLVIIPKRSILFYREKPK